MVPKFLEYSKYIFFEEKQKLWYEIISFDEGEFCVINYAKKSCRMSVEFDEKHIIQILYSLSLS